MKCTKCGEQINEGAGFCSHCGEKVVKESVKNDKKTNKKLFILFAAEIILVILIALGFNSYYNKNFNSKYATQDDFKKLVNSKGYTIENITSEDVKVYDLATINGKDLGLHYIIANNNRSANKVFNSLYYQIESRKQSGTMSVVSVDLINYNYYSLENNGNYFVVVKNDNTVFAATGLSKYKNEINTMVEDLGFGYPASVIYIIFSIVIIVFILTFIVMWKIFVKAGRKGWQALIPFYNFYCLSKMAFNKGWLFILMLITPINIVFIPVTFYKLAKRFGKSTVFALCSVFFPYITMQIIAFDNSKYISYDNE